jgi:hypothetical protein
VHALSRYALPVSAGTRAYVDRVIAAPGVARFIADALAEQDFLDFEEPYRNARGPDAGAALRRRRRGARRAAGPAAADRDWVAVGGTPEQLLAAGYRPVGRDFPVFLHPHTNEEVALARTERKSGRGYHGFTFHAAPGRDAGTGPGAPRPDHQRDGARRARPAGRPLWRRARPARRRAAACLDAFVEDPVRLLRVARFAARFPISRWPPRRWR